MRVSLGEGEGPNTSISFPAVPKFQFSLILWERNAKTDGLQMTKSLAVRSPLLLMRSCGDDVVL
jgi:hypothetical protein